MYISNTHVKIVTDNKALIYLHTAKKTNDCIYRWIIFLQNFDHEIIYRAGKLNPSDFLSRIDHKTKKQESTYIILTDIKNLFQTENSIIQEHEEHDINSFTRQQTKFHNNTNTNSKHSDLDPHFREQHLSSQDITPQQIQSQQHLYPDKANPEIPGINYE